MPAAAHLAGAVNPEGMTQMAGRGPGVEGAVAPGPVRVPEPPRAQPAITTREVHGGSCPGKNLDDGLPKEGIHVN